MSTSADPWASIEHLDPSPVALGEEFKHLAAAERIATLQQRVSGLLTIAHEDGRAVQFEEYPTGCRLDGIDASGRRLEDALREDIETLHLCDRGLAVALTSVLDELLAAEGRFFDAYLADVGTLTEGVRQYCPPVSPLSGVRWLYKDEDALGLTIPARERDVSDAHLSIDLAVDPHVEIGEGAVESVVICDGGPQVDPLEPWGMYRTVEDVFAALDEAHRSVVEGAGWG